MPTLELQAKVSVLPPPVANETQKRFENEIAGTPGETYTESDKTLSGSDRAENTIGFKPPAERKRMDALLAELDAFLNPGRPANTITPDEQPLGS